MQKRYFFIGDSHPRYTLVGASYRQAANNIYLCKDFDEAISFYLGSTMWSFPTYVDVSLAAVREDFSEFQAVIFVFGTNDAMKRVVDGDPLQVCVDRYLDKVVELSERLSLPHPLVLSPTPSRNPHTDSSWTEYSSIYHPFEDIKARFKEVDQLLQQGCLDRSLDFLSMYDLLTLDGSLDPQYSLDGIHFNEAGRNLYLERLDTYLQPQ